MPGLEVFHQRDRGKALSDETVDQVQYGRRNRNSLCYAGVVSEIHSISVLFGLFIRLTESN